MRGRVYRVAPKGHKATIPRHDFTKISGAVAALQSPNNAMRFKAWEQLFYLGKHAEEELERIWRNGEPRMRARALHLLARIEGRNTKYLNEASRDENPDIRITALRISRDLKLETLSLVKQLINDTSIQVRRECALSLRQNDSAEAAELWATLAEQHDGMDRWYLEALGIGAQGNETACFEAWLKRVGENWNTAAGRDIIWRSRAPQVAPYLAKIIADPGTADVERLRYFRSFDFLSGPEKEAALIELATAAHSGR
jgi:hypothetical protein